MNRYPAWGELVHVRTWPVRLERIFALRDYFVFGLNGELLGRADSAWLIISLDTRKPIRVASELDVNWGQPGRAIGEKAARLRIEVPGDPRNLFVVRPSDTDINHHVNHVRYVEWLLEGVPGGIATTHWLEELDVEFLGESQVGDTVAVSTAQSDCQVPIFTHLLTRDEGQSSLAVARTSWSLSVSEEAQLGA
jgi:acyl-ACP thioesterase